MDDKALEAIEARVNEVKGKRLFLGAMETQALADRKALLAEVKRLNIVLQDERKEHVERYAHLRSTYIREAKRLEKQLSSVTAERDACKADLYTACTQSPCNTGICAAKNCTGNQIPCNFEWRGDRKEQNDG